MLRLVGLFLLFLANFAYAVPQQVIIVRHGDKLFQAVPGPTLSGKGIIRSIRLAHYFEKTYGDPDVIIASDPTEPTGKDSSLRELQTIAPLANIVASHHPEKGFEILHPFSNYQYPKLAHAILTNEAFSHKHVLICWDHTVIPQLAKALGVTDALPKWPSDDFDTVFIIDFDSHGNVSKFTELHHQYDVNENPSFEALFTELS